MYFILYRYLFTLLLLLNIKDVDLIGYESLEKKNQYNNNLI